MVAIPESMPAHVSMENELPQDLYDSMVQFIGNHPDWDQYRLVQSAIADSCISRMPGPGCCQALPEWSVPPSSSGGVQQLDVDSGQDDPA